MESNYYLIDTFTREKFKGNPTPVCLLETVLSEQTMHSYAKEFNAPVTAFIEPKRRDGIYSIRYFTVTGEIPACGHATLGAAFILLKKTKSNKIVFETIEKIQLQTKKDTDKIFIEYPKFDQVKIEISSVLKTALGIKEIKTHFYCNQLQSLFIELKNANEVKLLEPDFKLLTESSDTIKEVVVMSKAENNNYDFILRSFCPWIGINEDPVTGSIHSVLGHYWKDRLNKNELIAYQASERGGQILIRPLQNTVEIGGYSEIIIEGQLKIK